MREQGQKLAARSRTAGQVISERARHGYDQQARRHGFADVVQLLRESSAEEAMRGPDVSRSQLSRLRRRYLGG